MSYRHDDDPSEYDLFGIFDADTLQPLATERTAPRLPKAFNGCKCICHQREVRHMLACCGPNWTRKP